MQSLPEAGTVTEVELNVPRADHPVLGWLGLVLVVVLFAGFIASYFAPAITEPDDNGYFAQATRWVTGGTTWFKSSSDAEYIGMHWLWDSKNDTYISRYPPGLPAFIAVLYQLGGYQIAMLANPILAVGALVGFYFMARRLISVVWALTGVVLLATNPTFIGHTLAGDSHMAVTFCLVWGTGFLLLWQKSGWMWQIFLAGLILGCIPSIRYPDSLVVLGVGAFILMNAKTKPHFRRHLLAAVLGALLPILPLLVRNQLVLGGFWRTGYALTNEQTGFGFDYFRQHAIQYLQIIQGDGLGIVFALGLVGIVWMLCLRRSRALGLMLCLYVLPMLLLYMAYYWAPGGNGAMTMRFLLPTFPIYLLAGMWMLSTATRATGDPTRAMVDREPIGPRVEPSSPRAVLVAVPIVLVSFQLLWGASEIFQRVERMSFSKRALTILTEKARSLTRPGDVLVTSAAMLQHADFVREWNLADLSLLTGRGGPGGGPGGGGPGGLFGPDANAPSPMQMEKQQMLRERYTGTTAERRAKFAADVTKWSLDTPVTSGTAGQIFILCSESDLRSALGRDNAEVSVVEKIQLPRRIVQPAQRNGPGGMPGAPGGFGGPGGGFAGPGGGFAGPGGNRPGGGGGMMGMANLDGTTWVIAKWSPTRSPTTSPAAPAGPATTPTP